MDDVHNGGSVRGGRMSIPRSRGATSGLLLILLGAWGALIPFVGPYFDFAWRTDEAWIWTAPRGWLEVLPGAATVLGGLLLLGSKNRATAMLGGWVTVLAGAWFVVGRPLRDVLNIGDVGVPLGNSEAKFAALDLAYFNGLGVVIVFLGALALGRLSVRSLRDIRYAEGPVDTTPPVVTGDRSPDAVTDPTSDRSAVVAGEPRRRSWRDRFRGRRSDRVEQTDQPQTPITRN